MAIVLALFGAVTLFMSTSVLFDLFGIREREGAYVPFVVVANFACSLLYLAAAWGWYIGRRWAVTLLAVALVVLVAAFAGLLLHIRSGGLYETKTVGAMVFRTVLTGLFVYLAHRSLPRKQASGI